MYKLVIADDEQIVIDSLKYIIEKNFKDVVVAGTARSGREAIERAESVMPDIVFMDIKMPGINGIDAIREIKSRNKNTVFIIMTAFDQFDYAKEAVNLGVIEYLLKPVNREKVVETVKKAVDMVKTERDSRNKELELKEKLESLSPILENGFVYSMIFFDDNSHELDNYRHIFGLEEEGGYVMTMEFGEAQDSGKMGNRIGFSVRSQSFYSYFRDIIKTRFKCIVGPVMLNRIVVFIPSDMKKDEYTERVEALSNIESVINKMKEKTDADFSIGIGRSYKSMENLFRSYEESIKAIRYAKGKGIMHIMDVPAESNFSSEYPLYKEKLLLERANLGDTASCIDSFNIIFDWLITSHSDSPIRVKSKLLEIIYLIQRLAWEYGINSEEFTKHKDYLEEMLAIENNSQLKAWCREKIEYITNEINIIKKKRISSVTRNAKEYIDSKYNKNITLEDVSKEVNISPHYFSKIFKEETGENFIDYLTSIRIIKAKEFLGDESCSVKEVCFRVGYSDPNYFSRLFKKVVGVTPTEFKESIQK